MKLEMDLTSDDSTSLLILSYQQHDASTYTLHEPSLVSSRSSSISRPASLTFCFKISFKNYSSNLPFTFRKSAAFPAIFNWCLLGVKIAPASWIYALSHSSTLMRNRPSIIASRPPVLVPAMRSNSRQGCVGVLRPRFKPVISDRRIIMDESPRTPPPSRESSLSTRDSFFCRALEVSIRQNTRSMPH